jgi:TolB-like protein
MDGHVSRKPTRAMPAVLLVATVALGHVPLAAAQEAPDAAPPPAAAGKATLAILPFAPVNARVSARQDDLILLQDALIRTFVQTAKFDVLERAKIESVIDEHAFSTSALGDPANAAQLGKLVGAQYVVVGNVHDLGLGVSQERIPYVDEWKCTESGRVRVELRVVQTKTGRIVAAHSATASDAAPHTQTGRCGEASRRHLEKAIAEISEEIAGKVIDAIYPLRVVRSSGDTVTLNRGEGGDFEVGSVLECFSQGERIVDPDTGDVLGSDETSLGTVKVTEIRPKLSKAQAADGVTIPEAAVCRIVARKPPAKPVPRRPAPRVNW